MNLTRRTKDFRLTVVSRWSQTCTRRSANSSTIRASFSLFSSNRARLRSEREQQQQQTISAQYIIYKPDTSARTNYSVDFHFTFSRAWSQGTESASHVRGQGSLSDRLQRRRDLAPRESRAVVELGVEHAAEPLADAFAGVPVSDGVQFVLREPELDAQLPPPRLRRGQGIPQLPQWNRRLGANWGEGVELRGGYTSRLYNYCLTWFRLHSWEREREKAVTSFLQGLPALPTFAE